MTRNARRLLPAILLGSAFGIVSALVIDANAAPLSPEVGKAASAKAGKPSMDPRLLLLEQKAVEAGVKNYTCPAQIEIAGTSPSFGPASLAFTTASVSPSSCGASSDLAPASARGGHCMTCSYQNGVALRRSGGPRTVCWRVPETNDKIACEEVPQLPPSQTCQFEIRPPAVDLEPLDHVRGDDDLWADGGLFRNFSIVNLDAALVRGTGSSSGKLFLEIDAEIEESAPDYTTFRDSKRIEITSSHLAAGTAADIAACLGNFTANRPFTSLTGTNGLATGGYDRTDLNPIHGTGTLRIGASCKVDSPGEDIGDVGCNPIAIEPFTLSLR